MIRVLPRWCAALTAIVVLAGGAVAAHAQRPSDAVHFFAADTTEAGVISLHFFGARGARVVFYERIGERLERLGTRTAPPGQPTVMRDAAAWRCARLVRRFEATSTLPDGTRATGAYSVRTPSCATRFELGVPRRLAPGELARVRVVDRWANGGVSPQLCVAPPGAIAACRKLRLRRAVTVATRRFRVATAGRWQVELRIRGHRLRRAIVVGRGTSMTPPPTVLTTGDSTMQGIDSFLADELAGTAIVRSDVHVGTGISKPGGRWATLPRKQVRRLRPAATVMSIGAVDGFSMKSADGATHECCGAGWAAEYSRRARAMIDTYRRRGRGRVLWLTLPIPRGRREVADAVNAAVVRAAEDLERVTVLRLDTVFTPTGYRDVMPYRGRNVRVRERDGIHLSVAGSAIAARLVAAALRLR